MELNKIKTYILQLDHNTLCVYSGDDYNNDKEGLDEFCGGMSDEKGEEWNLPEVTNIGRMMLERK